MIFVVRMISSFERQRYVAHVINLSRMFRFTKLHFRRRHEKISALVSFLLTCHVPSVAAELPFFFPQRVVYRAYLVGCPTPRHVHLRASEQDTGPPIIQ